MNKEALDLWNRACKSLKSATALLDIDPDSAASRAYYAVFHAVSAKFLLEGKIFSRHSALESAVHKELVKPGKWPVESGQDFSWLSGLRSTGDYGGVLHVNKDDAIQAVEKAKKILALIESPNPSIKEQYAMIKSDDLQTGKEFKDLVQKQVPVSEVLIYGSRARGEADPDSDLDILVVVDDEETGSKEKVYDAAWETGLKRNAVISTVVVTRKEITQTALSSSPLIMSVKREGIAV